MGLGFFISLDLFIIAATTFAVFIKRKRVANIIWAIITIALCVFFTLIFERSWILNWLKTLFLSPSRFPFLTYANVLAVNYQTEITRIIIVVPILLISWLILEILRTDTGSEVEALWLISIGGIVNHLLMISLYSSPSISLILPLVMLVIVWVDRFSQKQQLIFLSMVFFLSLIPTMVFYLIAPFPNGVGQFVYYGIMIFVLIINLYWSRNWIIQQTILAKTKNIDGLI
jgi:hypothetical protein